MKNRKQFALILTFVLILGILTGCGSKTSNDYAQSASSANYATAPAAGVYGMYDYDAGEMEMVAGEMLMSTNRSDSGAFDALPQNRKWIINMNISAETDDLDAALSALSAQILAMGGYVENQNINNTSSYRRTRSASMTIRIPAEQADSFLNEVTGFTNVTSHSRNVKDITLSYSDTEGRVKALKTEEARLLELMEMAEDMCDLLEIESRLTDVRYELERYSSTLRLYDNQVDYATISLSITEVQKYTPVEETGFFKRIGDGLAESITDLGKSLVDLAAWIIVNLPYLLLWGAVILVVIRIAKRTIRKKKAKKQAAKQENQQ